MLPGLAMLTGFAVLTRFARLTRFPVLARLLIALIGRLVVAALALAALAHERLRLRLRGNETGLLAEMREALALVIEIVNGQVIGVARLLRLVLAELLLGGGNQAEIVLSMLVVVLGSHRVARGAGVAGELDIFLGHMGGGAADLDVRPVGFEHAGQRVLAAPVIIIVTAIPVAHPLVVLTVSHVLPLFQPCVRTTDCHRNTDTVLKYRSGFGRILRGPKGLARLMPVPTRADLIDSRFSRQKRVQNAFPTHQPVRPANHVIQPACATCATTDPVCLA